MYKIFAYVGSYRGERSVTVAATNELTKYIAEKFDIEVETKIYTPNDICIKECRGCTSCFLKGKCHINDDVSKLKEEMKSSDIIIFASPVYYHQVSGSMKTFIDRISSWAHTFELRGKFAVTIDTSDTNGNGFVKEYLNKAMEWMGMSVLMNMSLQSSGLSDSKSFESVVRVLGNKVISRIKSKEFPISSKQEIYFQNMKQSVMNKEDDIYEKKYWSENGLLKYNSFHEMFNDCVKTNNM